MIEVLFIRVPEEMEREKMFTRLRDCVSIECYNEARSFRNKEVALRRLLGESLAGFALKKYCDLSFGSYRIVRGEKGKPFVEGQENVFFNISHSGEYVVCVVSNQEVGIDIEKRAKARMEVAGRFFHELEVQQLKALSGKEQDQLFFNYWSVKESYLKYVGTGLTRPLNSFVVMFAGVCVVLYEDVNKLPLHVNVCPVDPGYACYVCGEYHSLPEIQEITFEEITCC